MITTLYTFSIGSYVVAYEWNANFTALNNAGIEHAGAIEDAQVGVMFPDSDPHALFSRIDAEPNSFNIAGTAQIIANDCEYYKSLASGEDLTITVPSGLKGQARIILKTVENRVLTPLIINYTGGNENIVWFNGLANWYKAGMKFVFLLERNGKLFVKMCATED